MDETKPQTGKPITRAAYGSDIVVDLLKLYGIEYVSLNPGASFRSLHDSLVNYFVDLYIDYWFLDAP